MAWELEIHTIDVSQGESALVIAKDTNANLYKSMLIDAGLKKYASTVNAFVANKLGNRVLDFIVTSHYDIDHSGGITQLLTNDNFSALAYEIADKVWGQVGPALVPNPSPIVFAGIAVGAFVGYTGGGYNDGNVDATATFTEAVTIGKLSAGLQGNLADAISEAFSEAKAVISDGFYTTNDTLLKYYGGRKTKQLATGVGNLVANNLGNNDLRTLIYNYLFNAITPNGTNSFSTRIGTTNTFRYSSVTIYDPGDSDIDGTGYPVSSIASYKYAIQGKARISGTTSQAFGPLVRTRNTPGLGNEILGWENTVAAPHVYCLARGLGVYDEEERVTQDNGNGISIGLAIQFGKFAFFTGGDLPSDGLDMIPAAFLNRQGFGNLTIIPAFKAGHHGASGALNQDYLDNSSPVTTFISCGYKQFGNDPNSVHPDQTTINLLQGQGTITKFFLTNCKIERNHIPASREAPQLVLGNKSRVSGDNGYDPGEGHDEDVMNPQAKVQRGNISLLINQAESSSNSRFGVDVLNNGEVFRRFRVNYYENDAPPNHDPNAMIIDSIGATTNTIFFWQ